MKTLKKTGIYIFFFFYETHRGENLALMGRIKTNLLFSQRDWPLREEAPWKTSLEHFLVCFYVMALGWQKNGNIT